MGKSTISTGPFSIAMLVYQRVPFIMTLSWDVFPGIEDGHQSIERDL